MRRKKRWQGYEKQKAKERRAKHVGGPGKPDFLDGIGEVKDWNKPVGKYALDKEIHKGRTVIIAKKGFTKPAIEHTKRYHPRARLYRGKKRII